jgi:N-acyl-D-amino-acid deacylase
VAECGTWEKPIQPARGIEATIVNGAVVWRGGPTGKRSGRVLRRQ